MAGISGDRCSPQRSGTRLTNLTKRSSGGSPSFAGHKYQPHIDFLIAFCNIRKEQTRRSCPSNLVAPLTLRYVGSALVRWLCVTGFRRVCPSIFLSIGFFETDETILTNQYGVAS
jgi:hypothetical protein